MTLGMDTSFLLRLLTGEPAELAERALDRFLSAVAAGDDFRVNDVVVAESYYALQHHYGKSKEESLAALRAISADESVSFSQGFVDTINLPSLAKASPGFLDRLLTAGYRVHGNVTISCEKSFRRLPDTEIVTLA